MQKRLFYLLSSATLIAAALTGCGSGKPDSRMEPPVTDVARPIVDSVLVSKTYPGYLSANRNIKIVSRVNGYLLSKSFTDGDLVHKGQVLFRIEPTKYEDAVNQAKADLETAIATNKYATSQYHAMKKALESDAVSQMDVVQAESSMNESLASIENARAALRTAQTNLGYCTITSPVTGHISAPIPNVGDYISGEGSPEVLTTVYEDNELAAVFSIEESQYIKLKNRDIPGIDFKKVPVTFTDPLPHEYFGELTYLAPSVDVQTGSVTVKVNLKNEYGELKNGMYAEINLPDQYINNAVLIRDASISTDQLGKFVYVVNDSNKVVYTPIKVGALVRDSLRVVTEGLDGNERYVTKALLKVRDGMIVKPRE